MNFDWKRANTWVTLTSESQLENLARQGKKWIPRQDFWNSRTNLAIFELSLRIQYQETGIECENSSSGSNLLFLSFKLPFQNLNLQWKWHLCFVWSRLKCEPKLEILGCEIQWGIQEQFLFLENVILSKNKMTDTRRRVKLYALNAERQWDDKGTGHVSSNYVERLKGISLLVRAEADGKLITKNGCFGSWCLLWFIASRSRCIITLCTRHDADCKGTRFCSSYNNIGRVRNRALLTFVTFCLQIFPTRYFSTLFGRATANSEHATAKPHLRTKTAFECQNW